MSTFRVNKFQEGGPAPAPAQGGGDPLMEIMELAQTALESQDCEAAMAVCQAFLQLVSEAQGGEQAPEEAPEGEPVYRRGGKLVQRVR